mgnify:FL=1
MKLNLGCGLTHKEGYVNIDNQEYVKPDLIMDLTQPWKFEDNSIDAIRAAHIMEHFDYNDWSHIIKEMYRVIKDQSPITIIIPDPRHKHYLCDPTHKLPHLPETYNLLSKRVCDDNAAKGFSNSQIAYFLDVDFIATKWDTNWDNEALEICSNLLGHSPDENLKYADDVDKFKAHQIFTGLIEEWQIHMYAVKENNEN